MSKYCRADPGPAVGPTLSLIPHPPSLPLHTRIAGRGLCPAYAGNQALLPKTAINASFKPKPTNNMKKLTNSSSFAD